MRLRNFLCISYTEIIRLGGLVVKGLRRKRQIVWIEGISFYVIEPQAPNLVNLLNHRKAVCVLSTENMFYFFCDFRDFCVSFSFSVLV